MRLRDRVMHRGPKAKKEGEKEPKDYPLNTGDWSLCDESEDGDVDLELAQTSMAF